jgi:hypothetical protein
VWAGSIQRSVHAQTNVHAQLRQSNHCAALLLLQIVMEGPSANITLFTHAQSARTISTGHSCNTTVLLQVGCNFAGCYAMCFQKPCAVPCTLCAQHQPQPPPVLCCAALLLLQVVMQGPSANITLFNVALENLAYGDEASGILAEGTSILLPSELWAFHYRR